MRFHVTALGTKASIKAEESSCMASVQLLTAKAFMAAFTGTMDDLPPQ